MSYPQIIQTIDSLNSRIEESDDPNILKNLIAIRDELRIWDRLLNQAAIKQRTDELSQITPQILQAIEKIKLETQNLIDLQSILSFAKGLTSKIESALR